MMEVAAWSDAGVESEQNQGGLPSFFKAAHLHCSAAHKHALFSRASLTLRYLQGLACCGFAEQLLSFYPSVK